MHILYVANIRLPTEKAHGVQIMKTCEALAKAGAAVTLVVPRRHNALTKEPFSYYGMNKNFTIVQLPTLDVVRFGPLGFFIQSMHFSVAVLRYVLQHNTEVIFSRDEMPLWFLQRVSRATVWESHTGAWNFFARSVARHAHALIVITQGLKDFYIEKGIPAQKITVAHDAVDLNNFSATKMPAELRTQFGLPHEKKIVMYVGRLDGWKGVDTLCEATQFLSAEMQVVIVGGEKHQVEEFKKRYPKILFLGFIPYEQVASIQSVADALVLPNTGRDIISQRFTSPLKLFTYMASGKPMVASDLPSIREVLDDSSCYFVAPDDPQALAEGVERALSDSEAPQKAARAKTLVTSYTWDMRAQKILAAIQSYAR